MTVWSTWWTPQEADWRDCTWALDGATQRRFLRTNTGEASLDLFPSIRPYIWNKGRVTGAVTLFGVEGTTGITTRIGNSTSTSDVKPGFEERLNIEFDPANVAERFEIVLHCRMAYVDIRTEFENDGVYTTHDPVDKDDTMFTVWEQNYRPWEEIGLMVNARRQIDDGDDTMIWDRSTWDHGRWDKGEKLGKSLDQWVNILPHVTRITTSQGGRYVAGSILAEAGTMTITATGDLKALDMGIKNGAPIILSGRRSGPLFTGHVTGISVSASKTGHDTVTITCADNIKRIAAITRYGAAYRTDRPGKHDTPKERITRLMKSAPGVPYRNFTGGSTGYVNDCVWETSLANHLDALCVGFDASWRQDVAGDVVFTPALKRHPSGEASWDSRDRLYFADDISWRQRQLGTPLILPTGASANISTSNLVTAVEVTDHSMEQDQNSNYTGHAKDVSFKKEDQSEREAYGGATVKFDVVGGEPGPANEQYGYLLSRVLKSSQERIPLDSISFEPLNRKSVPLWRTVQVDGAPYFVRDYGNPIVTLKQLMPLMHSTTACHIGWARQDILAQISRVKHTITPTNWTTTLELAPWPGDHRTLV